MDNEVALGDGKSPRPGRTRLRLVGSAGVERRLVEGSGLAVVGDLMFAYLYDAQRAGHGQVRAAPLSVAFDYAERGAKAQDVTHPDLLFVLEGRRGIFGEQCVEGAPDLVIEVLSRTTRTLDLPNGPKFEMYQRYGVAHYWIVDIEARTLTQYVLRDGIYGEPVVLRVGNTLRCPLFPEISCPVAQVFSGLD